MRAAQAGVFAERRADASPASAHGEGGDVAVVEGMRPFVPELALAGVAGLALTR